jgi:aryl carrier-like protein
MMFRGRPRNLLLITLDTMRSLSLAAQRRQQEYAVMQVGIKFRFD